MNLREDINKLVEKYQRGGMKRLLDDNTVSDTNKVINFTKAKNINPINKIKTDSKKIEEVSNRFNVSRKKAVELIQKQKFEDNVARLNNQKSTGSIEKSQEEQSLLSKGWEIATNPATALEYVVNNQRIPDNFSKGKTNNLDIATSIANPLSWIDSGIEGAKDVVTIPEKLIEGDFKGAGKHTISGAVNLLGVVPAAGVSDDLAKLFKNKVGTKEELNNLVKSLEFKFLNKPESLSHGEKKLLSTVRNVGSIVNSGELYSDAKLIEDVFKNSSHLNDDQFILLTGFDKNSLNSRLKALKEQPISKQNVEEIISDTRIPLYSEDDLVEHTTPIFRNLRVPTTETNSNSLLSNINKKVSPFIERKPLEYDEELMPTLYKRENLNPMAKLKKAYDKVNSSEKGKVFLPANSLSSDSYPMTLKLVDRGITNDMIDVNYHGYKYLNSAGFPDLANLDEKLILKEINSLIDGINSKSVKKLPKASIDDRGIKYPEITVTRKKLGGNVRNSLNELLTKFQKGGVAESKWEYSDTNGTLKPQSILKTDEIGYLKGWLESPMANKIAFKREGQSGIDNLSTRLDRISGQNLEISTAEDLLKSTNSYTRKRGERFNNKDLQGTSYTSPNSKYGNIVTRRMAPENVILHEGTHQSTGANQLLLRNDVEDILSRVRDDVGSYLSNPTEVHARLNVLRKELKDSGIVDPYKSPITKEHLNKFLNNYKKPGENNNKPLIEANSGELLNILNSQDDAVWLLNNIVDNRKTENNMWYAQLGGNKPMNKEQQIAWWKEYINSPKYLERLKKEYPNADEETINRLYENRKNNFQNASKNISIVDNINNEKGTLGVNYARKNDYRNDEKYNYRIHPTKAGNIEVTKEGLKLNPSVFTHEISHGITDGTVDMPTKTLIDIINRTRGNRPDGMNTEGLAKNLLDPYFKKEREFIDRMLPISTDTEKYLKEYDAFTRAGEEFDNPDNYEPFSDSFISKKFNNIRFKVNGTDYDRPIVTDYTSDPTEYLSRMQSFRQELKNQGIYDASKEDFTEEHLNKFKELVRQGGGNAILREMYPDVYEFINATKGSDSYNQPDYMKDNDEDTRKGEEKFKQNIIWMMNNIAKNNSNNNTNYAQRGGEIRNALNSLSKKFY